jgi:hypothetical protein
MAFTDQVVFGSGVTFNGPVTFNADSFTVNANIVSIDDYNIVLGDTAQASDNKITEAGGGGLLLRRGSGNTAEWLWTPTSLHGITGIWTGDGHIGFKGNTGGLRPNAGGNLLVHGTGIRIDGGATTEHGLIMSFAGNGTTTGRTIEMSRYSPAGTTAFIEVNLPSSNPSRPFVAIKDGANKKTVRQTHSHTVGTPVRIDPTNGNYVAAQGNNAVNAEVVGIVSKVIDGNTFELTFLGEVYDLNWSAITADGAVMGITGAVYYLSTDVAGKVIPSAPTLTNTVHKAVFIANTSSSVIVIPWTGGVLSESVTLADSTSNTVTINQINQFKPGDVIRFRAVSGGITLEYGSGPGYTASRYAYGAYVRADAKNSENADSVAGMVVSTIPFEAPFSGINESFNLMMDGFFSTSGITATNSGTPGQLIAGRNYFLSVNSAGTTGAFEGTIPSLTDARPTGNLDYVEKPVMFATSPTTGYVYSYRGTQVAATTESAVPMTNLLIRDLRSSSNADLIFGVYSGGGAGGQQVMVFDNTAKGNVRIGPSSFTSSSVGAGSTLSVQGTIVSGDSIAGNGSVIIASRYDAAYPTTLNVFGSMASTGNSVLAYGVRPKAGAANTYQSTTIQNAARTAIEVGVDNSDPMLRLSGLTQRTAAQGSDLSLTELFKVSGLTATFAGFVSAAAGVSGPTFYGNATTASALRTSRTIALTGDVTATGLPFDGSGNISLTTAIAAGSIVNADIADGTITDAKLATISTANKVNNSATTATDANTGNAIVARDANGNFNSNVVSLNTLRLGSADMNASAHTGSAPIIGARAWGRITPSGAASNPSAVVGANISSVVRTGAGVYRVTFATPLPANYAVVASSAGQAVANVNNRTTVNVVIVNSTTFDIYHALANTSTIPEFTAANIITFIAIG